MPNGRASKDICRRLLPRDFPPRKPSTTSFASGARMAPGRGWLPCANEFASKGTLSPAPGQWITTRQDDRHRRGGTRLRRSKKIKGRKRQLLVGTQDLALEARVHSAKIQDRAGIEKHVPSGRRARPGDAPGRPPRPGANHPPGQPPGPSLIAPGPFGVLDRNRSVTER